jgi:hypothetical protein
VRATGGGCMVVAEAARHRSICSLTAWPCLVVMVSATRLKSVNSLPVSGPVRVRQREYSGSGSTEAIVSTVTPQ